MIQQIDRLIAIAQDVNLLSEAAQLSFIKQRFSDENCEMILPLVGEFSAGKTTLINSLTDSKQLETATKPTTATIYEIHFGCDSCYAEVYNEQGEKMRIEDISSIKNEKLGDSVVINVFDTAKRLPSNIVLVDTPGLSSEDPRHKQTLIDFLPNADGVLLVVDVNQQITRSLTDFINMMNLARPRLVCVSAAKGDTEELYELLDGIQAEKGKILAQVNEQRLNDIVKVMVEHIGELLKTSSSDKDLEDAIRQKEQELKKIDRTITRLIEASEYDIESEERNTERKFQDTVFERLDAIAASKSSNFNAEAISAINNTASICLNDFKNGVEKIIADKIKEHNIDDGITFNSLQGIDMSQLSVSSLSYDLDLDSIGHEYDGMIATGVKVAAAVAAVTAVVATAGGAAGAVGAAETATEVGAGAAELAMDAGGVLEAVDIASDVGNIVSNQRHISRVQQAVSFVGQASEQYNNINQVNANAGNQVGAKKGLIEGMVGFVTDKTWGKPQRRRAIREYIDGTLAPQFKVAMSKNSRKVTDDIAKLLYEEAQVSLAEKKQALETLQEERKQKKESYNKRLEVLRDYQNELLTL